MNARIFIVEDEPIVRLDLQVRLQRLGYTVIGSASRGEEAIARAAELKPDLVLMDVCIDGPMDGIEAARQIRADRWVPILFVTANANAPGEQNAALFPCLSKPFRAAELKNAVAGALEPLAENHRL